ncbi:hypothetical protein [Streptomyces caniferus]|uniref:hypothetical protein n=1 Tax=Streptomyces caniferus TaxID=285557 RepID=UPI00383AEE03
MVAAISYLLVSGCAWRALPPCFGASKSIVHRRLSSRPVRVSWAGCISRFFGSWTNATWPEPSRAVARLRPCPR